MTIPDPVMAESRSKLFARFTELGIDATTVPYPAHSTVEEGKALRGSMSGTFTKNLLLKDKKGRLYLFSVHEDVVLDLKTLHARIGASGRLGFASAETVLNHLGVLPGALTPLALINDRSGAVTAVLDAAIVSADRVNFHPLLNTESTQLKPAELITFIRSCEREPLVIDLG